MTTPVITELLSPADPEVKDFTVPVKPIKFRVAPDIFEAVGAIPGGLLMEFGAAAEQLGEVKLTEQLSLFNQMFSLVLDDDSVELFIQRMRDKKNPITLGQAMDITNWLMEKYGMRPTQPSEASSDGQAPPASGTNLTASAPPTELTSPDLPPPDFST
jgi:hypothetical protein